MPSPLIYGLYLTVLIFDTAHPSKKIPIAMIIVFFRGYCIFEKKII